MADQPVPMPLISLPDNLPPDINAVHALVKIAPEAEQPRLFNHLAYLLYSIDPVQTEHYARKALFQAARHTDIAQSGEAYRMIGISWDVRGNFPLAIEAFDQAEALFRQIHHRKGLADVANNRGLIHTALNEFSKAIQRFQDALVIRLEIGDRIGISATYNNLGLVYTDTYNQLRAIEAFSRAHEFADTERDPRNVANILNNLGNVYKTLSEYHKALEYFQQSYQLQKTRADTLGVAITLHNMGNVFIAQSEFVRGTEYFNRALIVYRQFGEYSGLPALYSSLANGFAKQSLFEQAIAYCNALIAYNQANAINNGAALVELGRIYYMADHLDRAQHYITDGLQLIQGQQLILSELDAHRILGSIMESYGDFEQAYRYQSTYITLQRQMDTDRINGAIAEAEALYQTQRKNHEIQQMQLKTEEQEIIVRERTRDLERALERETALALRLEASLRHEAELSRLKSRIIETISHEFRTPLSVVQNSLTLLRDYYDRLDERKRIRQFHAAHESVSYITELLDDILFVDTVRADMLTVHRMTMTLDQLAEQLHGRLKSDFADSPRLRISYTPQDTAQTLVTDHDLITKLLINLVSNGLKYSTREVGVHCTLTNDTLELTVADFGIGIPDAEQAFIYDLFYRGSNTGAIRGLGLGLHIVQQISSALDGHIHLHSRVGIGTTISVIIPVGAPVADAEGG